MRRFSLVTCMCVLLAVLGACAGPPQPTTSVPTPSGVTTSPPVPSAEATTQPSVSAAERSKLDKPGLHRSADGKALAVGVLRHSDLEGGFWTIARPNGPEAGAGNAVVVVTNARDFGDLASLEGTAVAARGTPLHGASVRQAGQEFHADWIAPVSALAASR